MEDKRFADDGCGERIKKFRYEAGLSQQTLSELSGVSSDTIKRIEQGRQRPRIETVKQLQPHLNTAIENLMSGSTKGEASNGSLSSIRVFTNWKESAALIANAKSSVVVIDSILFLDLEWLTDLVIQAARREDSHLEVSIYMASPRKAFGAQRSREMAVPRGNNDPIHFVRKKLSRSELDKYESDFNTVVKRIEQQLRGQVKLRVYEYLCMPSIRIIAIDGARFVFGVFPLFERNPRFPCFFLDQVLAINADAQVLEGLTGQIKNTEKISIPHSTSK